MRPSLSPNKWTLRISTKTDPVTDYDESTLHFRVDSIEKTSPSYADHDIAFARISWYVENGSKYRAFLNYMDVSATQDGTELHSTYLDDDSYSTTRKVTPGVKMTTTVAFETPKATRL